MPELPEVETTVRELKNKIVNKKITGVWTDAFGLIKRPKSFKEFEKEIKGKKILDIKRRGKNILIELDKNKVLLIHQKLTGHLLFGEWEFKNNKWWPKKEGPLKEAINRFIHLILFLDKKMLALSDLRKFAKIELWDKEELLRSKEFKSLGPEPLDETFTFNKFKEILKERKGKIKKILMDQNVIAGIGNIYSDEILFEAKVHPLREVQNLKDEEMKKIYLAMKKILKKGIELKGESISDYRRPSGEKGDFDKERRVYRRENQPCLICQTKIKRIKLGGRSSYFCPKCQK